jgi:hypothetical protein
MTSLTGSSLQLRRDAERSDPRRAGPGEALMAGRRRGQGVAAR